MHLERVEPPEGGREVVLGALSRLLAELPEEIPPLAQASNRLLLSEPHRSFGVDTRRLLGGFVGSAYSTGWRYLVADSGTTEVVAAVEVVERPDGTPSVVGINDGPLVSATARGIELAEQTDGIDPAYEVQFVDVPAVSFAGLWLVGSGGDRRVVPLVGLTSGVATDAVVSEDEVLTGLVEAVTTHLSAQGREPNPPEPDGG